MSNISCHRRPKRDKSEVSTLEPAPDRPVSVRHALNSIPYSLTPFGLPTPFGLLSFRPPAGLLLAFPQRFLGHHEQGRVEFSE